MYLSSLFIPLMASTPPPPVGLDLPITDGLILGLASSYGVMTDGFGYVTEWRDFSPYANHMVDSPATTTISPSAFGTEQGLSFNGASHLKTFGPALNGVTGDKLHVWMVVTIPTTDGHTDLMELAPFFTGYNTVETGFGIVADYVSGSPGALSIRPQARGNSATTGTLNDGSAGAGSPMIVEAIFDKSDVYEVQSFVHMHSFSNYTYSSIGNTNTNNFAGQPLFILNDSHATLGAALIYNRHLNTTDRNTMVSYLKTKYGV